MGDIRKKNKSYDVQEISQLEDLPPGLKLEIDGSVWDFQSLAQRGDREDLAYWFSVYFWRNRSIISNKTRVVYMHSYRRFWEFLDSCGLDISKINQIDFNLMLSFKSWLNLVVISNRSKDVIAGVDGLSQGTKRHIFGAIGKTLRALISYNVASTELQIPHGGYKSIKLNTKKTIPYSQEERAQIVKACAKEFELADTGKILDHRRVYVPYILTLALRTGLNLQPLLDLKIDSIGDSILDGRLELKVNKNRGYSSQKITFSDDQENAEVAYVSKKLGPLINKLIKISEPLRLITPFSKSIFLIPNLDQGASVLKPKELWDDLQVFRDRYELVDGKGESLELNIRRMRPTFAHHLLKVNGGDIRHLQKSLNHKNIHTTMGYLDANQSEFKSSFKFNGIVMQHVLTGSSPEKLSAEIDCTLTEAEDLIAGKNDMKVTRCRNPNRSPFQKSGATESCTQQIACFRCPNQVITITDAHKIFSFYWWLLSKKNHMPISAWEKQYDWIIRTIDMDIYSKLGSTSEVEKIKHNAYANPHPVWKY